MADRPYCSSPWLESHLFWDGQTRPCDHNQTNLGNWQEQGLEAVWKSATYQNFRAAIYRGDFPGEQCRSCHAAGTTKQLYSSVYPFLAPLIERLEQKLERPLRGSTTVRHLLTESTPGWEAFSPSWNELYTDLRDFPSGECGATRNAVDRAIQLLTMTKSCLTGEAIPKHVAPIRQARIINKCNARCVMCAAMFNGDVVSGPNMDERFTDAALFGADQMISFASESSEFLLYRDWKRIVEKLSQQGLPKLNLFTNGMLLTPETSRYLIDHNALQTLHISVNGGTRSTIESTQVNVKFDRLAENIRAVFAYADEKKADFLFNFSFIVMKRNYREMADFVDLIQSLRGSAQSPRPNMCFAWLESNNEMENYRDFLFQEHHSLIPEKDLQRELQRAQDRAHHFGLHAALIELPLAKFLTEQMSAPRLSIRDRDVPRLAHYLESGGDREILKHVFPTNASAATLLGEVTTRYRTDSI